MLLVAVGLLLGLVGLTGILTLSMARHDRPSETSRRTREGTIGIKDSRRDEWAA